jgi:hypothetical protein
VWNVSGEEPQIIKEIDGVIPIVRQAEYVWKSMSLYRMFDAISLTVKKTLDTTALQYGIHPEIISLLYLGLMVRSEPH